jgi:N-acetylmuramate 1-kinase
MDTSERAKARARFAFFHLGPEAGTPQPAAGDASFRSYWRVSSPRGSFLIMDAPTEHEDVRPWLDVGTRLRDAGLHAPAVLAQDLDQGFLMIEDFGNRTLLPELTDATVESHYGRALDTLLAMQARAPCKGLPEYDRTRLVAEMELLPTWFLQRHLGVASDCAAWDEIEAGFDSLATAALAQPKVFVHRDFHSRNLMLLDGDAIGLIDFQDAVRGPITYDLVSLLRDCYIVWPEEQVSAWVEGYRQRAVDAGLTDADSASFARWFDLIGLQRHIKVLGIFCRLYYRDGKAGYLNDLPRVWDYTRRVGLRHTETRALVERIAAAIGARDLTQPQP